MKMIYVVFYIDRTAVLIDRRKKFKLANKEFETRTEAEAFRDRLGAEGIANTIKEFPAVR